MLLQLAALAGFVCCLILWLLGVRQEKELMGICVAIASGAYIKRGINAFSGRAGGPSSTEPPVPPREPDA